jgi:2-dehydro-3-deoxyphosphooctonate aldolase (KDO 8-P synthase)
MNGIVQPNRKDLAGLIALSNAAGGDRRMIPTLAAAAVATGVNALFMEVHPDPDRALCDGANSLPLEQLKPLLSRLLRVWEAVKQ